MNKFKCCKGLALIMLLCCSYITAKGQDVNPSKVFAHNDYVSEVPFFRAYELKVGYIEADVFLEDGALSVAHEHHEIKPGKTLVNLYLEPLKKVILKNGGNVFENQCQLTLMIDLKTAGEPTLDAIVQELQKYRELTSSPTLSIMISGNVPDPALWHKYPRFIFFDGRPGIEYSLEQWERILMISTSFKSHIRWDGHSKLPPGAKEKMRDLSKVAHRHGKKFRFWATPDFENAWRELLAAKMDVIVTDRPADLIELMNQDR